MLASEETSFTVSRIPGTLSRIRRKRRVEGGRQGRREGKEKVEEEGTIKKKDKKRWNTWTPTKILKVLQGQSKIKLLDASLSRELKMLRARLTRGSRSAALEGVWPWHRKSCKILKLQISAHTRLYTGNTSLHSTVLDPLPCRRQQHSSSLTQGRWITELQ